MINNKDIIMSTELVTIMGHKEMYIENYKGIIEYNAEKIIVQTKKHRIEINGSNLLISYFTNLEMKINGDIKELKYLYQGEF